MTDTTMQHGAVVRVTHWLNAVTFIAFVLSGIAILLAYPRLHWGEVGHLDMPAFLELPLPQLILWGGRGPGRSIHFLAAWLFVVNGIAYLISGIRSGHFRNRMLPQKSDFTWQSIRQVLVSIVPGRAKPEDATRYNPLQRVLYCSVVFGLLPIMFITGLAMSPTVNSVVPFVELIGGHQSARTLHFFAATALLLFFLVHLAAALRFNFFRRCRAMIIGR